MCQTLTQPQLSNSINQQSNSFTIILLCHYFLPVWELPGLTQVRQSQSLSPTQFSTSCQSVQNWSLLLEVYFQCLHYGSLERNGINKNKNTLWKTQLMQGFGSPQRKKHFQDCCQCSLLSAVGLHRSFAIYRWVDEFLVGSNGTDWTIIHHVKSYRCPQANNLALSLA